jgi:hypothetical protein
MNSKILASLIALSFASIASAQQDGTFPPGGPGQGGPGGQQGQGQRPRMDPAQMLERMDANGDGKLSKDEVPPQLAERMFERADTNKDGMLDKAELEAMAAAGGARGGQGGQGGQRGGQGGAPMNLEGAMKQMNASYKALNASPFDAASKAADLEAVQRLQMSAIGAKGGVGALRMSDAASKQYGGDKAAFEAAYRRKMIETAKVAIELELAILDGKADAAKALVAKLHALEESGHEVFKADEGGAGGQGGDGEQPRNPSRGGRGNRGQTPPATN